MGVEVLQDCLENLLPLRVRVGLGTAHQVFDVRRTLSAARSRSGLRSISRILAEASIAKKTYLRYRRMRYRAGGGLSDAGASHTHVSHLLLGGYLMSPRLTDCPAASC